MKPKFDLTSALAELAEKYDDPRLWLCAIDAHDLRERAEKRRWDSLREWTLIAIFAGWAIKTVLEHVWR